MVYRYMFINSSGADQLIHVITQDSTDECELVDGTPVEKPEQVKDTYVGEFDLTIPAGAIYGFITEHTASVKIPKVAGFVAHTVNGTVPWPEPPPSRSGLSSHGSDFTARYRCFLDPANGPAPALASRRPSAARAIGSSDMTSAKLDEIISLLHEIADALSGAAHASNGKFNGDDATVTR